MLHGAFGEHDHGRQRPVGAERSPSEQSKAPQNAGRSSLVRVLGHQPGERTRGQRKAFGTDSSARFVNGVLGSLADNIETITQTLNK